MKNIAKCARCKDIIESKYTHNFVWCKCGAIAVDGGPDYCKRVGEPQDILHQKADGKWYDMMDMEDVDEGSE